MTSKQPQHCEHECVCPDYLESSKNPCDGVAVAGGKSCNCPHDTRTHSSAPAPDANNLQTFPFSAVCCRKCSDHEPTCHDICGAYQTERDAAIREQAKREERERIAKQIEHNASNRKYHSYTTSMQIVEYLRGEQP